MRRRPILTFEEIDDGLEVTKAINDLEKSRGQGPEQVAVVAERTQEMEENAEEVADQSENPELDEQAEQAGVDIDEETPTDTSQEGDEFDYEAAKVDLEGGLDDAQALECIACDLETGQITELSEEQKTQVQNLAQKYQCDCANKLATEGFSSLALEDIKTVFATIGNAILNAIQKLIAVIKQALDIYRSQLRVAVEDIDAIRANAQSINGKTPARTAISNGYNSYLMLEDTRVARNLISNVTLVDQMLKGYFDHVRTNMKPYMDSVSNLFTDSLRETQNLIHEDSPNGERVINTRGSIRLNKDTLPGFMRVVTEIKGHAKPGEGLIPVKSRTIPGGVALCAWVSRDDDVSTAVRTSVLSSKFFLSTDYDYEQPDPTLPVLSASELSSFLSTLEKLVHTLSNGESHMLYYHNQLTALQNLTTRIQADGKTLERMDVLGGASHLIAYKRRAANLMLSLISLTDNFYGKPNRSVMFYGNRFLTASLKYANAVTSEYLSKPQTK